MNWIVSLKVQKYNERSRLCFVFIKKKVSINNIYNGLNNGLYNGKNNDNINIASNFIEFLSIGWNNPKLNLILCKMFGINRDHCIWGL